jgi:hypothetical protein
MNTEDAKRLQALFHRIARECDLPEYQQIAIDTYSSVIEDVSAVVSKGEKEAIFVYKPRKGEKTGTSIKVSNFRFRITDFFLQIPDDIIKIIGTHGSLLMYYYILRLLVKLLTLSAIKLEKGEVDVLMLVHSFEQQRRKLSVDQVYERLMEKWTHNDITSALENLEALLCIEIGVDRVIEPVEAIVFL